MSISNSPPPIYEPLQDENQSLSLKWIIFFNNLFNGDAGQSWTPTIQNLTTVGGTPQITGRVYQLSKYLTYFSLNIIPVTNTSATAGTTFIDNFPFTMKADGICADVSNKLGGALGMCEKSSNRIWIPSWTTVTAPISIIGIVEAS